MKQTYLYLWYPLFQAEWDRCDQQNRITITDKITKDVIADQTVQVQIPTHGEIIQNNF
jgi:hypothetical protein